MTSNPFDAPRDDPEAPEEAPVSAAAEAQLAYLHATAPPKLVVGVGTGLFFGLAVIGLAMSVFNGRAGLGQLVGGATHVVGLFMALTGVIAGVQGLRADETAARRAAGFDAEHLFWQLATAVQSLAWGLIGLVCCYGALFS